MGKDDKKKSKKVEEEAAAPKDADKSEDKATDADKKESDKRDVDEDKKDDEEDEDKKKAVKKDDDDEKEADAKDDDADEEEGADARKRGRKRGSVDTEAPVSSGREKRARKSATAYKPEDFSKVDHSPTIIDGKGTPIGDMAKAKESIESYKDTAEELALTYRFLYAPRGRLNTKEVKSALLKFNGYIPKPEKNQEEADIKKAESAAEKKFAARAYKLHVPQLKTLLDVVAVDKSEMKDKEALVEGVLDFFSEPDEGMLKHKGSKKAAAAAAKKKDAPKKKADKTKKTKEAKETDDSELEDVEVEEGKEPDETQLRKWVRAYVRCFDTSKATLKHAMGVAEDKFGVALKDKKDLMKKLMTEEM